MRERLSIWFRRLWQRLRGGGSPLVLGVSVGIGLFIGCLPLYGLHLPLCLLACVPFGLDAVAAYLAAQISNPWVAPFLLTLEARIGSSILGRSTLTLNEIRTVPLGDIFTRAFAGSLVVGAALALAGGAVTALVVRRGKGRVPKDEAMGRTLARYRGQPLGLRIYVATKLRTDPVVARLAALGSLGRTVDAGAGRGQMGLYLWELGRVSELSGFDPDAPKLAAARAAAGSDGSYEVSSLEAYAPAPESVDSVLLIDVLHYLAPAEQDAVLSRLKQGLRAGGRLLIREVSDRSRFRGAITRAAEWAATTTGYNRAARSLGFRPLGELVEHLERLGFVCSVDDASAGTPFDNALIVARLATGTQSV